MLKTQIYSMKQLTTFISLFKCVESCQQSFPFYFADATDNNCLAITPTSEPPQQPPSPSPSSELQLQVHVKCEPLPQPQSPVITIQTIDKRPLKRAIFTSNKKIKKLPRVVATVNDSPTIPTFTLQPPLTTAAIHDNNSDADDHKPSSIANNFLSEWKGAVARFGVTKPSNKPKDNVVAVVVGEIVNPTNVPSVRNPHIKLADSYVWNW